MKTVTFETNKGSFTAELFPDEAPVTVENFEKLVKSGFYDGIIFHRVIPDFVVQGGDPITKEKGINDPRVGTGGPGWKIKCETQGNPHRHEEGSLSMAHAGKDTGGSQFFIVLNEGNTRHLNGVHTVFGKVTQGIEVVRTLAKGDKMERLTISDDAS
ncbi:MAG TPA: peptidylprolyl isomerase [Longimicrobiaceae bacterium]|jgi:peptidyl-prolyl cis-trans isomerase B (cyclophilin B)|nr:peptidylprolyl isomerase [Longimicrobiaceae bacterium]